MWSSRRFPLDQQQEAAGPLHAALDPQGDEAGARRDEGLGRAHRLDEGVLLAGDDLQDGVLGDHALSRRARSAGSVAASIAVQASAMAPSRTAASAEGVMQAAVNSCWWFTAPCVSIPISGWMVGTASETLAMSVEKVGSGVAVVVGVEVPAESLGVGPVGGEEGGVGLHVRVHRGQLLVVERAPGGQRSCLEARVDPGPQGGEPLCGERADHVAGRHGGGDDVGGGRALGDHAVHLVARGQLLAQQADGHLGDGQRVLRVDALPGCSRRVGLAPAEVDVVVGDGEAGRR